MSLQQLRGSQCLQRHRWPRCRSLPMQLRQLSRRQLARFPQDLLPS